MLGKLYVVKHNCAKQLCLTTYNFSVFTHTTVMTHFLYSINAFCSDILLIYFQFYVKFKKPVTQNRPPPDPFT